MSFIKVSNLTFAYPGSYEHIFSDVSLQIDTQWKLGFTGRNGRGKTTFFQLLLGKYPYTGEINLKVKPHYFPFTPQDETLDTLTLATNSHRDLLPWQLKKEISLLDLAEEVLYRPFYSLSPGEKTKILLALLFLEPRAFFLIDEPTNHLDLSGRAAVARYLKGKRGYIVVSHDRYFLDGCVDHILAIHNTGMTIEKGNFSTWWANKEAQDALELREDEKLRGEIGRLAKAAQQTANWAGKIEKTKLGNKVDKGYIGHKSAKMMSRTKTLEQRREKALTAKSLLLKDLEKEEKIIFKPGRHNREKVVELQNVTLYHQEKSLCNEIRFTLNRGERLALQGSNGVGKSTLLQLLRGKEIPYSGDLIWEGKPSISYIPQDASWLQGNLRDFAKARNIEETLLKTLLRKFDFSREQFEKDMAHYSAGQKKKVLLAASLCEERALYLWDEPLNYLDVISRIQLEKLILAAAPTLIFVEHDAAFNGKIATKTLRLHRR